MGISKFSGLCPEPRKLLKKFHQNFDTETRLRVSDKSFERVRENFFKSFPEKKINKSFPEKKIKNQKIFRVCEMKKEKKNGSFGGRQRVRRLRRNY